MSTLLGYGSILIRAVLIVAIVVPFTLAILILVNADFGLSFNPEYLAPNEYDNRVKVTQLLISIAGFSAAFYGLIRGTEVIRRGQLGPILLRLAELRTRGVELRNTASRPMTKEEAALWQKDVEDWKSELYSKVKELSEFESEKLRTLDTYPILTLTGVQDPAIVRQVSQLHETLKRLYELLQKHQ